mmetsp:Transcript_16736/g.35365  ORF Transcript_16736/g.35365 Transcript_16736/m.35365 type:complete len:670 (+) Transcript_16736:209-2218(+)
MATQWLCSSCTYANSANDSICKLCRVPAAVCVASTSTPPAVGNSNTTTRMMMTPPLLYQTWKSQGKSSRTPSLTTFSQSTSHIFSNYIVHSPISFVIPSYCHSTELVSSGRDARLVFSFSEMAIMACKAALFRDYVAFDKIVHHAKTAREAKALGRRVSPFNQDIWDAYQCSIVRDVTIAKLDWDDFRTALLGTGNDTIAECTKGDWVWGTALDGSDGNVHYPGRWKGMNILGWSLMEAREEAQMRVQQQLQLQQQQQQFSTMPSASAPTMGLHSQIQEQQQQQQFVPMPSAPSMIIPSSSSNASTAKPAHQKLGSSNETINPNSTKYVAAQYTFGAKAFGPLQRSTPVEHSAKNLPDLSRSVKDIMVSSVPDSKHMRGERGNKYVTRMLTDIYHQGLFMHGHSKSSVNQTIIPSFRYIISELNKLNTNDEKRISMVQNLVEACQDCQQVQARTILRMYGDLTCRTETLDSQLKYSLVPYMESALQILITKYHSPSCDLDHTKVDPERQRVHLWSGYLSLIGEAFGLDGVSAAKGDRFLDGCLDVIGSVHRGRGGSSSTASDDSLKQKLIDELTQNLDVKEWISGLIGDINNQSAKADRMIDRSCIFSWVAANTDGDFKYRIFYDDTRAEEYSDLDPKEPTNENKYEPFLSPIVLVEMLVKADMLKQKT